MMMAPSSDRGDGDGDGDEDGDEDGDGDGDDSLDASALSPMATPLPLDISPITALEEAKPCSSTISFGGDGAPGIGKRIGAISGSLCVCVCVCLCVYVCFKSENCSAQNALINVCSILSGNV